jgi:outer membrane protein TolC
MNLTTSRKVGVSLLLLLHTHLVISQTDTLPSAFSLEECIQYALEHQPVLRQSQIDEEITRKEIGASLAAWLPQVSADFDFIDNLDKPNIVLPNQETGGSQVIEVGVAFQSNAALNATQTLFNNDVRIAVRTASTLKTQARQNTVATQIDVFVGVSQTFFDLVIALDQIRILDQDISRLQKNVRDARNRYESGIADNVDYKQATIQLNNALAQRATTQELIPYRRALLKQQMGYPQDQTLEIEYNMDALRSEVLSDTIPALVLEDRIEYRLLQTQRELQEAAISRYRWGFLPSLNAFYNYQYSYFNDNFAQLYDRSFTSSQVGLRMSIPLIQGTARIKNLQAAKLQSEQLVYEQQLLTDQLTTEYEESRAVYQGAYQNWQLQRENEQLAQEVYRTIQLQYDEGIIPYIEVIQAETDLRSAQLNTSNALLQVLSSKVDLLRALGIVPVN